MNLISQYLYNNCTKASIAVFVVLLFILLANTGLRLVEDVNEGDIPSIFLIELLALKVVQYSSIIIPLSLFFGIIMTLNRLYVSNEMTIISVAHRLNSLKFCNKIYELKEGKLIERNLFKN